AGCCVNASPSPSPCQLPASNMSDDLDDLLRAAMKTLDEQVPSGYFEVLPDQTLTRLEGSMQFGQQPGTDKPTGQAQPPVEREEDSGLHDIRNLAASA